jgi:hypothetical protein
VAIGRSRRARRSLHNSHSDREFQRYNLYLNQGGRLGAHTGEELAAHVDLARYCPRSYTSAQGGVDMTSSWCTASTSLFANTPTRSFRSSKDETRTASKPEGRLKSRPSSFGSLRFDVSTKRRAADHSAALCMQLYLSSGRCRCPRSRRERESRYRRVLHSRGARCSAREERRNHRSCG